MRDEKIDQNYENWKASGFLNCFQDEGLKRLLKEQEDFLKGYSNRTIMPVAQPEGSHQASSAPSRIGFFSGASSAAEKPTSKVDIKPKSR